jgi:hypothetical protein
MLPKIITPVSVAVGSAVFVDVGAGVFVDVPGVPGVGVRVTVRVGVNVTHSSSPAIAAGADANVLPASIIAASDTAAPIPISIFIS